MNIAEILWGRLFEADLSEKCLDDGVLSRAGAARNINIIAKVFDPQAQFEGAQGALLPDDIIEGLTLGCGLDAEDLRVAATTELFRLQTACHRSPFSRGSPTRSSVSAYEVFKNTQ
jgi:hypothetical protein